MIDTNKIGRDAENLARNYLEGQGLKFRTANYSCKQGEIDLIMKDKDTVVFVEVRKRKHKTFGSGSETVQLPKQQKLFQAATHYLLAQNIYESAYSRFDIISINSLDHITWIKNAFERDYSQFV